MVTKYRHIIWDWNGTLLDDLKLSIDIINTILRKREMKELDEEKYKEIFDFPIYEYYLKAGFDFDKEKFEVVAEEYISEYTRRYMESKLHNGIEELLKRLKKKGISLHILSASNKKFLLKSVQDFGIFEYFDSIMGIDNNFAAGKVEIGLKWIEENNVNKEEVLFIGDTTHDYEVAEKMGVDCILISAGHQNHKRLAEKWGKVIGSILELEEMI